MTLITSDFTRRTPVAAHARGSTITAEGGDTWIDACSGAISCNVGHCHPHVVAQTIAQLKRADFVYRTQLTSAPIEELARRLCARLGYAGAFFANSGSEAMEAAVRSARLHWALQGRPEKKQDSQSVDQLSRLDGADAVAVRPWPPPPRCRNPRYRADRADALPFCAAPVT